MSKHKIVDRYRIELKKAIASQVEENRKIDVVLVNELNRLNSDSWLHVEYRPSWQVSDSPGTSPNDEPGALGKAARGYPGGENCQRKGESIEQYCERLSKLHWSNLKPLANLALDELKATHGMAEISAVINEVFNRHF